MTPNEAIRHNARVLLPQMRGKIKAERMQAYLELALGPLGGFAAMGAALAKITQDEGLMKQIGADKVHPLRHKA